MSDVFISYSRLDRERVQVLAQELESQGFSVWWDRSIPPGKNFDEVIEHALAAAGSAVVVWSENSIKSSWVKTEAAEAASRGVLIPILIDSVKLPLEFRRLQTADLSHWRGESDDSELHQAITAIRELLKPSSGLALTETQSKATAAPASLKSGAAPGNRPTRPAERKYSLLLAKREDGGGYTLPQLAVGYLLVGGLLSAIGKQLPPQPWIAALYVFIIPIFAMVRLRDTPFRVAGVSALGVLFGSLIVGPGETGQGPEAIVAAVWLLYLAVAGLLWAIPALRNRWRGQDRLS